MLLLVAFLRQTASSPPPEMSDENSDDDAAFESADEDETPSTTVAPPRRDNSVSRDKTAKNDSLPGVERLRVSEEKNDNDHKLTDSSTKPSPATSANSSVASVPAEISLKTTPLIKTCSVERSPEKSATTPTAHPSSTTACTATTSSTAADAEDASWSAWSSWGASLLSTASKSVSQFSTEVTEGLNVLVDASVTAADAQDDPEAERLAQEVSVTVLSYFSHFIFFLFPIFSCFYFSQFSLMVFFSLLLFC